MSLPADVVNVIQGYTQQDLRLSRDTKRVIDESVQTAINNVRRIYPGTRYLLDGSSYSTLFTSLQDAFVNGDKGAESDELVENIKIILTYGGYLPIRWDLLLFSFTYIPLTERWKDLLHLVTNKAGRIYRVYESFILGEKELINKYTEDIPLGLLRSIQYEDEYMEYGQYKPDLLLNPLSFYYRDESYIYDQEWRYNYRFFVLLYTMSGNRESIGIKDDDTKPHHRGMLEYIQMFHTPFNYENIEDDNPNDIDVDVQLYYMMTGNNKPLPADKDEIERFNQKGYIGYVDFKELEGAFEPVSPNLYPAVPLNLSPYTIAILDRPDLIEVININPVELIYREDNIYGIVDYLRLGNINWDKAVVDFHNAHATEEIYDVAINIPVQWRRQAAYAAILGDASSLEKLMREHTFTPEMKERVRQLAVRFNTLDRIRRLL